MALSPTLLILLFLLFCPSAVAFKILVYNIKFAHSHASFMGLLADTLAAAGNDVTTLMPEIDVSIEDGTTKSKVIRVAGEARAVAQWEEMKKGTTWPEYWQQPLSFSHAYTMGSEIREIFCNQCEKTLSDSEVIQRLREERFDAVITENFDFCGIGLSHLIGAKSAIVASTATIFENVANDLGIPVLPSYHPAFNTMEMEPSSFWSRVENTLNTLKMELQWGMTKRCCDRVFKATFGSDFPDLSVKQLSILFLIL